MELTTTDDTLDDTLKWALARRWGARRGVRRTQRPVVYSSVRLGLPAAALVMVFRLHRKAAHLDTDVNKLKGHLTFGLFYSSFRPQAWWWEATVAVRKIGIAAVGVFGGSMLSMQVHLTSMLMFGNIFATSQMQPFGKHKGLQRLEEVLLVCTWLTLWAGTVFNSHPRCEDAPVPM